MATFTDNSGRTWTVQVNVETIRRVRAMVEVDLLDTAGGDVLERLITDPVLLCDVLYALCREQADGQGVTDEQFGRAMAGDAIDQATEALLEELSGFFPSRKRRLVRAALQKLDALGEMALRAAEEKLESGEIEKEFRAELESFDRAQNRSGGLSISSPGSPASTPGPSP